VACIPRAWRVALLALPLLWAWSILGRANIGPEVLLVDVEGPIGPATAEHVGSAIEHARAREAPAVLLRIDTPGGLDPSMREIIREIVGSPVPVVGYVAPSGARAASAGTYIMYATHVSAMAPATTLGSATPVPLGAAPSPDAGEPDDTGASGDLERKIIEDARAYIRGLANLRGRNATWAERAVLEGVSLTASEAVRMNVVDLLADDVDDLLRSIDGRTVDVLGTETTLATASVTVTPYEASFRIRLLSIIGDPNVAYLLLMIGLYGLIFELASPGLLFPGILGAICLVLALFALATLPVNWAGLALILLGVGLMVAEVFVASVGILGIGGVLAFIVGSIILIDTGSEFFQLSLGLVLGIAIASAAMFVGVVGLALRTRRAKVTSGREQLVGAQAVALESFDRLGQVRLHGEIWQAQTDTPVTKGERLRVRALRGLTVDVEPWDGTPRRPPDSHPTKENRP
jgi:membrane-bound serine protease (ClpP class)